MVRKGCSAIRPAFPALPGLLDHDVEAVVIVQLGQEIEPALPQLIRAGAVECKLVEQFANHVSAEIVIRQRGAENVSDEPQDFGKPDIAEKRKLAGLLSTLS
jgi:hypothetical protein